MYGVYFVCANKSEKSEMCALCKMRRPAKHDRWITFFTPHTENPKDEEQFFNCFFFFLVVAINYWVYIAHSIFQCSSHQFRLLPSLLVALWWPSWECRAWPRSPNMALLVVNVKYTVDIFERFMTNSRSFCYVVLVHNCVLHTPRAINMSIFMCVSIQG